MNDFANFNSLQDFLIILYSIFLILCSAFGAGCTLGLLSLDILKLKIKLVVGTYDEKKNINKIILILKNRHLLLVTLLLFNALANESLPICLSKLFPEYIAIIISVTLVLLCGEIIPSAVFTGPNQIKIAATCTSLVFFLEILFFPLAFPLSKILDYFVGVEEEERFNRDEIAALMNIHQTESNKKKEELPLSKSEVHVLTGVLGLAKKTIKDICIPLIDVNMLPYDVILDNEVITAINNVGHSRLPVFKDGDRKNLIGVFLVKKLLNVNPENNILLSSLNINEPIIIGSNDSLLSVLNLFQTGKSHLAFVSNNPEELRLNLTRNEKPSNIVAPIGIVTIEDIFEEIINDEIFDEEDNEKGSNALNSSSILYNISMRNSFSLSSKSNGKNITQQAAIINNNVDKKKLLNKFDDIKSYSNEDNKSDGELVQERFFTTYPQKKSMNSSIITPLLIKKYKKNIEGNI